MIFLFLMNIPFNKPIKNKTMKHIKKLLIVFFLIGSFQLSAQLSEKKFDLRIGAGATLLGSGDMITFSFENELNYRMNPYFTSALSFAFGKSNTGVWETASYLQGNLSMFLSPFKNNRYNDFRLGLGISVNNVTDAYVQGTYYENGVIVDVDHVIENRNAFGYNIIIEDSYRFSEKFLIGFKLYTQPYTNGDINSGALIKFGIFL